MRRLIVLFLVLFLLAFAVPAFAQQTYTGTEPPQIGGQDFNQGPQDVEVKGVQFQAGEGLPVTGADIAGLAFLAVGLILVGMVLKRTGTPAPATPKQAS